MSIVATVNVQVNRNLLLAKSYPTEKARLRVYCLWYDP